MALTTRNIPQLFNGVSRQPPILRSIDQTESELNSWAAVSSGVGKRPPTESLAKIADSVSADAFIHIINRDATERYVLVIDGGVIRVFDFAGDEKVVNTPGGTGYLAGNNLAAVTVADYTFIINRAQPIGMKAIGADLVAQPAYVRDPVRTPTVTDAGAVELGGRVGSYRPNPTPLD